MQFFISGLVGKAAVFVLALGMASVVSGAAEASDTCTYTSYNWNVRLKRAVNLHTVSHPYSQMTADEVDWRTGCTVCKEDQRLVQIGRLEPFYVCRQIADKVQRTLERLLRSGQPILEVTAYRPGRTRNPLDAAGNRTGFSNHAYGTAIDINRSMNGLYRNCLHFGPACRLILGGPWVPGNPGTLERNSPIVRAMKQAGFRWGGEIAGKQKDFMHFSMTGY